MAAVGIGADGHDNALPHGSRFAVHGTDGIGNEQRLPLVLPGGDLDKKRLISAIGALCDLVRLAAIRKNLQYGACLVFRIIRRLHAVRFLLMGVNKECREYSQDQQQDQCRREDLFGSKADFFL